MTDSAPTVTSPSRHPLLPSDSEIRARLMTSIACGCGNQSVLCAGDAIAAASTKRAALDALIAEGRVFVMPSGRVEVAR